MQVGGHRAFNQVILQWRQRFGLGYCSSEVDKWYEYKLANEKLARLADSDDYAIITLSSLVIGYNTNLIHSLLWLSFVIHGWRSLH